MAHNVTIKSELVTLCILLFCYFSCKSSVPYHEIENGSWTSVHLSKIRKERSIGPLSFE